MNLETLLTRLEAQKGNYKRIADETGLTYSWLTKLAKRRIPNPGVRKIEKLSSHPLLSKSA